MTRDLYDVESDGSGEAHRHARLRRLLRLVVITDSGIARPRSVEDVVEAALQGGARAIQLRDKRSSARAALETARRLRASTRAAGALLLINDRVDVALASSADGVHVGPTDLPIAVLRRSVPSPFVLGYSTDDPEAARRAESEGADYLGCGAVWKTRTKNVGDEAIGLDRLAAVVREVNIPVVGIGSITVERARDVAATRAAGVAVVGAVMGATDPEGTARALLAAFDSISRA